MRLVDFCFALRPLVLVPAWSFFLIGRGEAATDEAFPWLRLVAFTSIMAGAHLVNQVVDAESDRINGKGFFLQRGMFEPRDYILAAVLAIGGGLAAGFVTRDGFVLLAAAAALGLAYSLRPLRLAARPGFDVVANAVGYGGIAPLLGAAARPDSGGALTLWTLSTTLAVGAVFLHTTLLDVEGDRRTGKRTTGVVLGSRATRVAAAMAAIAAWLCAAGHRPIVQLATGLLAILVCAALSAAPRITSRTVVVSATALFAIVAATFWPPFLLWIAFLVVATRIYYARRFALRYPAL